MTRSTPRTAPIRSHRHHQRAPTHLDPECARVSATSHSRAYGQSQSTRRVWRGGSAGSLALQRRAREPPPPPAVDSLGTAAAITAVAGCGDNRWRQILRPQSSLPARTPARLCMLCSNWSITASRSGRGRVRLLVPLRSRSKRWCLGANRATLLVRRHNIYEEFKESSSAHSRRCWLVAARFGRRRGSRRAMSTSSRMIEARAGARSHLQGDACFPAWTHEWHESSATKNSHAFGARWAHHSRWSAGDAQRVRGR